MLNQTEKTANIGMGYCKTIASENDWLFRDQPALDIGIDAHMEIVDELGNPKQLIALQVKSGESYFKEETGECIIFRQITERQYKYWTSNPLPCIIVLFNPTDHTCIWERLTTNTIKRSSTGKGFLVRVPKEQVFIDAESNEKLLSITNLPQHVINYNYLLSQKKFMQIIKNGGTVKLHSQEWVNKCSGKGSIEVIVDDGHNETKYLYPYYFPHTLYTDVFPKLFPWANFEADEEFYEEDDKEHWHYQNCSYDSESGRWLPFGDSFEEFRKNLDPMRYKNHAGEVAEYMLIMTLNELGESFLEVDKFVSDFQPYSMARPKEK